MQFLHLLLSRMARSIDHQINGLRRLRERDHLAQALCSSENHHDAIESQRNAAVRRRPVLQRIEEESKPLLRFGVAHTQRAEDLCLYILLVNTNRSRSQLCTVQDDVVG